MNCGHMAGASGFSLIHFPLSIEQLKRSGPARRHSTPSAPAGLNFFGRRLMGGPENLPKRPGPSGAKTAWKRRMEMPHGNAPSPCRHSKTFQARARRVRLLACPRFGSFFKSKFKAPKNGSIARFQGLGCYQTSSEIGRASGRARAAGAARETGLARRGGFLQSGPLLPIALPLAFSGRKPPCPLPSFKTRPC